MDTYNSVYEIDTKYFYRHTPNNHKTKFDATGYSKYDYKPL